MARRRGNFAGYVRAAGASGAILVGVVLCAALLSHLVALSASTVGLGPKDAKAANPGIISEVRVAGNYADFDFRSVVSKATEVGLHSVQAVVGLGLHRRPPFDLGEPDVIVPLAADAWSVSDIAIGAAFAVMVLLGLYVGLRRQTPEPKRIFAWACAAVLCASVILQSIYGRVAFLYSQHWLFPMVFRRAGLCQHDRQMETGHARCQCDGLIGCDRCVEFPPDRSDYFPGPNDRCGLSSVGHLIPGVGGQSTCP